MDISKIYRSFKRTIEVEKPDGSKTWITHESGMEATLEANDEIKECSVALLEMAKSDVVEGLKADIAKIQGAGKKEKVGRTMPKLG